MPPATNLKGFDEDFKELKERVLTSSNQILTFRRAHVWEDTMRLHKKGFRFDNGFKVKFVGEPAIDHGGPKRELFTLLRRFLGTNNSLFEGPPNRRLPRHNIIALIDNFYFLIGKIMASALLHGPENTLVLAPTIVNYLVKGLDGLQPQFEDVCCKDVRDILQQVNHISTALYLIIHFLQISGTTDELKMQSLLENDVLSCCFECGVDKPSTMYSLANKQSIIQALSTHFILFTRKAEIDQLGQGLDHVGLLSSQAVTRCWAKHTPS